VNWTVTDIHGNVSLCSMTVTVTDDEDPVITCPADILQTADAGVCEAAVTVDPIIASDNCTIDTIVNDYNGTSDASDVYPVGTTTVTWTVTDLAGNTSVCTMSVTVTDDEDPVIACPADITQTADAGVCEAAVVVDPIIASDNCTIDTIVNDYNGTADASDVYPVGTTVVNWTVTDIHGNVSTCSMTVIVTDDENPVITCPADINQTADAGVCEAVVTVDPIATSDNCAVDTIVNDYNGTSDASDVYPVGTTTVNWTVTDIHGNVSTCSMTVIVTDDENPVITCPDDISSFNDPILCEAFITVPVPVVTDNCAVQSLINDYTGTEDASASYIVGATVVTWTVTDIHGNESTCSTTITVEDPELPVITCDADIAVFNDPGECSAAVTVNTPVATDNCSVDFVINDYNNTNDASDNYPVGTTVVTWTVFDIYGNSASCQQTIIVTDNEAPAVTCPANITQTADAGLCEALVNVPPITASDNCQIGTIVNDFTGTDNATAVYPVGTTTVTWTVTDIYGNISVCSMEVTVTDNEAPAVDCSDDITINTEPGICEASVIIVPPVVDDNCGILSVVNDYNSTGDASDIYPEGSTTVTWTITDIHGNTSTCSQVITVNDEELPVITCPADLLIPAEDGLCEALVTISVPAVNDNCGIASLINDYNGTDNATDIYPVGTTVVTWTVTDVNGNTANCQTTVTVSDAQLPGISCPDDITIFNDPGVCGATITMDLPVADDNCGIASVINDFNGTPDASGFYPVGITNVTWTVTDVNGNSNTCVVVVEITDNEAPGMSCPEDITQSNDTGECGAVVIYDLPSSTDNCIVLETVQLAGIASGGFFPVGTTVNTYQVTDAAGNTTTCSFSVTIEDNEQPEIICPADIAVSNDPGMCGAIVTFSDPTVIENCGTTTLIQTEGPASGSEFPVGVTTITYEATDGSGNVISCSFTITVNDTEFPVILCPDDISQIDPIVIYELPQFTDNCGAEITLLEGLESGDVFPHGYTTVTYAVTDEAGNTSICSFEVLVNTPPDAVDDGTDYFEEDTSVTINVTFNDSDPDGDDFTITSATAGNGIVYINNDGTLTYVVDTELFCGIDTITYVICDIYNACDTAIVIINIECFIDIIIPEGFSPNGDGVNDFFEILGLEDYPRNTLTIFNRWGHKVYEKVNYQNDWGGWSDAPLTLGDGLLPKGTYYYVLDLGGDGDTRKGYFFLNR
jgi:gliding motility-associated-like protein